jgi:hypothetical protein
MRRAQKPIEYGPRTPLRGFKEGAKNPQRHKQMQNNQGDKSAAKPDLKNRHDGGKQAASGVGGVAHRCDRDT